MNTQSIWDELSNIQVGTIVAWVIVIGTIVSAICFGAIKLYRIFEKYKESKDKSKKQEEIIQGHEKTLKEISETLLEIKMSLNEQKDVNLKQIRHTIVHTCEDALDKNEISINKLRSLEEMYDEYVEVFHGNGYVKTLVNKVRELHVVGKIDD